MKYVLSLCDITGGFVEPWVEAGYGAILVDPQHGITHQDGPILKVAATVLEAMPIIADRLSDVVFVAGFPPCTDMAVSGARWFAANQRAPDTAMSVHGGKPATNTTSGSRSAMIGIASSTVAATLRIGPSWWVMPCCGSTRIAS